MAIADRRSREQEARHQLIISTARRLAETEGWEAVTTRRLSAEIEYSQPVLYKHFARMDALADAVAIEGFAELSDALRAAGAGADTPVIALRQIARTYLDFARENPAVYEAMFTRGTVLQFATDGAPPQLTEAFAELRRALVAATETQDADTGTEVVWASLHGLATLSRGGRLRPEFDTERLDLLMTRLAGT